MHTLEVSYITILYNSAVMNVMIYSPVLICTLDSNQIDVM